MKQENPLLNEEKEEEYIESIKQWYNKHHYIVLDILLNCEKGFILTPNFLLNHFILRRLSKEATWKVIGPATLEERKLFCIEAVGKEPSPIDGYRTYKLESVGD